MLRNSPSDWPMRAVAWRSATRPAAALWLFPTTHRSRPRQHGGGAVADCPASPVNGSRRTEGTRKNSPCSIASAISLRSGCHSALNVTGQLLAADTTSRRALILILPALDACPRRATRTAGGSAQPSLCFFDPYLAAKRAHPAIPPCFPKSLGKSFGSTLVYNRKF